MDTLQWSVEGVFPLNNLAMVRFYHNILCGETPTIGSYWSHDMICTSRIH